MLSILLFIVAMSCTFLVMFLFAAARSATRADECMAYWAANRRLQPRPYHPQPEEPQTLPAGHQAGATPR